MREIKTCPDQGWQHLSTSELDQLLQAELEKDHPNEEVVLPILQILEEREKDYPVEKTPDVLALLGKLNEHETSSKQSIHKRRWIAGIAAVAAAACIVVMAFPRTVGAENILGRLFRWTESIFEFLAPGQDTTDPPVDIVFETGNPGLQQIYDKVTELGVTEMVVPMWLPEGFELSDLKEFSTHGGSKVHAKFENGSYAVLLSYRISTDISAKIEKEDTGIELFEFGDTGHIIVENTDNVSATWTVDGVECVVNTNLLKEDVYTIIKSIYRSELS